MQLSFVVLALLLYSTSSIATGEEFLSPRAESFEPQEHAYLGDAVTLKMGPTNSISGARFDYTVGKNVNDAKSTGRNLTYGQIIALAGDYYANTASGAYQDAEQISDNWDWDSDHSRSYAVAKGNALKLQDDTGGYLKSILDVMKSQTNELKLSDQSRDAAQTFEDINKPSGIIDGLLGIPKYDGKYSSATSNHYAWAALNNWDHFGSGAIKAYSAVHKVALDRAKESWRNGNRPLTFKEATDKTNNLRTAYFYEAFASHFLTDLFSSGHLRTPRRILHSYFFGKFTTIDFAKWPADKCTNFMHDEDSANGLWVTNLRGESWAAYGDKQMFNNASIENTRRAIRAVQIGADEVYEMSQNGRINMPQGIYKALVEVPRLDTDPVSNFAPMFKPNVTVGGPVFIRKFIDDRSISSFDSKSAPSLSSSSPTSNDQWAKTRDDIQRSNEYKTMYTYSKPFQLGTDAWHIRQVNNSHLVINKYGPIISEGMGKQWQMKSQSFVNVTNIPGKLRWVSTTMFSNGMVSLLGQRGSNEKREHHIGLNVSGDLSSVPPKLVWNKSAKSSVAQDMTGWGIRDVVYGKFSNDSSGIAMIKYWTKKSKGSAAAEDSKLQLWRIPAPMTQGPRLIGDISEGNMPLNFTLPYEINEDSESNLKSFVGYSFDKATRKATWFFYRWTKGYTQKILQTFDEPDVLYPAQALFEGAFSHNRRRLIRVSEIVNGKIYIDVLRPQRLGDDSPDSPIVVYREARSTRDVTWGALQQRQYLTWFLADVQHKDAKDLVTVTVNSTTQSPKVVVFPGGNGKGATPKADDKDFNFDIISPKVSENPFSSLTGHDFTAGFMKPLLTSQVNFTYPGEGTLDHPTGILNFFDNYGILGARLLAPTTATSKDYSYNLKGQIPAIAGQLSNGLGATDRGISMGRNGAKETIGLIVNNSMIVEL